MARFTAKLESLPHGGHYVVVPDDAASEAALKHAARVRGTVNGAPYRSSLMKYSGVFHMGVHNATMEAAELANHDRVDVTIELDDAPLPTDTVPDDLARALAAAPVARRSWERLSPSARREYVKNVLNAKREATRSSRIEQIVRVLRSGVPKRRTWSPSS